MSTDNPALPPFLLFFLPRPFTFSSVAPFTFSPFPFLVYFAYFLLLSIPSFLPEQSPLHFQAGDRRRRSNLGLVCFVNFVVVLALDFSASIIQGSSIGPASYVVTASDLRPVSPSNFISKYADDTYLIIPADNIRSCSAEIDSIDTWALNNNLKLNRSKSVEIVFVRHRGSEAGT